MHARQLLEAAALLSLRSTQLMESGAGLCSDALAEYWIASRCRLDQWGRALRRLGHSSTAPPPDESADSLTRLVEEVTLSEALTRVVAAVCLSDDTRRGGEDSGPIGQNTLDAHRESTSRLRALVFAWWPAESPRSRHARTLTKETERWTDLLLAYVGSGPSIERLAFDASRLREFAYDSQVHGADSSRGATQLLVHGIRSNFDSATATPLNGDLNRRVAGAATALFGAAGFDGHGVAQPPWALRAERVFDETAALVDRLFADTELGSANRLPQRWRT